MGKLGDPFERWIVRLQPLGLALGKEIAAANLNAHGSSTIPTKTRPGGLKLVPATRTTALKAKMEM